jgi:hypothetical protein
MQGVCQTFTEVETPAESMEDICQTFAEAVYPADPMEEVQSLPELQAEDSTVEELAKLLERLHLWPSQQIVRRLVVFALQQFAFLAVLCQHHSQTTTTATTYTAPAAISEQPKKAKNTVRFADSVVTDVRTVSRWIEPKKRAKKLLTAAPAATTTESSNDDDDVIEIPMSECTRIGPSPDEIRFEQQQEKLRAQQQKEFLLRQWWAQCHQQEQQQRQGQGQWFPGSGTDHPTTQGANPFYQATF